MKYDWSSPAHGPVPYVDDTARATGGGDERTAGAAVLRSNHQPVLSWSKSQRQWNPERVLVVGLVGGDKKTAGRVLKDRYAISRKTKGSAVARANAGTDLNISGYCMDVRQIVRECAGDSQTPGSNDEVVVDVGLRDYGVDFVAETVLPVKVAVIPNTVFVINVG